MTRVETSMDIHAFFALVSAGLWKEEILLSQFGEIDYATVMQLAEEQGVIGLVTAGLEQVRDVKIPQAWSLQFIGSTLQIEQRNKAMNQFIARLVKKLRAADIYTLLIKGQGVAQCYEKPLWRVPGDVDLYLSKDNYEKAKNFLVPFVQHIEMEDKRRLHYGMTIEDWVVELHGTMHTALSRKINQVSDEVYHDLFYHGNVRSWKNEGVQVFLPSAGNDLIIIFNHFIEHFYGEGIGLRQVCDWCRVLWTYRKNVDLKLLESRIRKAGLTTEWKAFAAFSVDWLGLPVEAMPLYEDKKKWHKKAIRVRDLILETGNLGHNNDVSYRSKTTKWNGLLITFGRRLMEFIRISTIFPINAPIFFLSYVSKRIYAICNP